MIPMTTRSSTSVNPPRDGTCVRCLMSQPPPTVEMNGPRSGNAQPLSPKRIAASSNSPTRHVRNSVSMDSGCGGQRSGGTDLAEVLEGVDPRPVLVGPVDPQRVVAHQ